MRRYRDDETPEPGGMGAPAFFAGWALALVVSLAACASAGDGSRGRTVVTRTECLPMVEYSRDDQARAAAELAALPHDSEIAKFVADYGAMRAANRACRAASGNP